MWFWTLGVEWLCILKGKDKGRFDGIKIILSSLINKTVDQMELTLVLLKNKVYP